MDLTDEQLAQAIATRHQRLLKQATATIPLRPCAWLKAAIKALTGRQPCDQCVKQCKQMDAWGWAECWRRRETIAGWMRANAAEMADKDEAEGRRLIRRAQELRDRVDAMDARDWRALLRRAVLRK